MKVSNTHRILERILFYTESRKVNALLSVCLAAPVSTDEIIFEDADLLEQAAEAFRSSLAENGEIM